MENIIKDTKQMSDEVARMEQQSKEIRKATQDILKAFKDMEV